MNPETWRAGSVFDTEWAKQFHHYTSENNWCVLGNGGTDVVSRGSVVFDHERKELCVVWRVEQRTSRDMASATSFAELKRWTVDDARGQQFLQVQTLTVEEGVITEVDPHIHEHEVTVEGRWTCLGCIEEWKVAHGVVTPKTASHFTAGCEIDDPMFVVGINMDACRTHRFSGRMDGSCFVYGRDMAGRGSYTHFVWPMAAVPKGVDPSMATALIARDIAFAEQCELRMLRASETQGLRWQKVFAHLGNFVSDRDGSDAPLGRIKAVQNSKNEWKGFRGCNEGYTIGARGAKDAQPFHGSQRMFRGVCVTSPSCRHRHTYTHTHALTVKLVSTLIGCVATLGGLQTRQGAHSRVKPVRHSESNTKRTGGVELWLGNRLFGQCFHRDACTSTGLHGQS